MSIIETLVTDRTLADVGRQLYLNRLWDPNTKTFTGTDEEFSEFLTGTKGTYKAEDLNRVGSAMNYVASRLTEAGYAPSISPRIDWTQLEWLTPETAAHYLSDLAELRGQFEQMASTPEVPADMEGLTYQEANDIEKILADIDRVVTSIASTWVYTAQPLVYCGFAVYPITNSALLKKNGAILGECELGVMVLGTA